MWKPRRLRTLWVSTACYWDSFTFFLARRGENIKDEWPHLKGNLPASKYSSYSYWFIYGSGLGLLSPYIRSFSPSLDYLSTLKTDAVGSFERFETIYCTIRRQIPEDSNLYRYRQKLRASENTALKKNIVNIRWEFNSFIFIIRGDSKLLSGFPFIGHGKPDNNLESSCIIFRTINLHCFLPFLFLSSPQRYRTMRWGRCLTPSPTNNSHNYSIVNCLFYITYYTIYTHKNVLLIIIENTRYTENKRLFPHSWPTVQILHATCTGRFRNLK
jgi:hypothetical protein